MSRRKQLFMDELDNAGYRYTNIDPDDEDSRVLTLSFKLNSQPGSVTYWVFFDSDDHRGVQISAKLAQFSEDKKQAGIAVCNDLNSQYRWAKFYIDKDNDLFVDMDDSLEEDTVIDRLLGDMDVMDDIIEKSYPALMKALWA